VCRLIFFVIFALFSCGAVQCPFCKGGNDALFSVAHSFPLAMSKKKAPKKKLATLQVDRG